MFPDVQRERRTFKNIQIGEYNFPRITEIAGEDAVQLIPFDIDEDGRLDCDEFAVAMYLCLQSHSDNPMPKKLPLNMMPPSKEYLFSRCCALCGEEKRKCDFSTTQWKQGAGESMCTECESL